MNYGISYGTLTNAFKEKYERGISSVVIAAQHNVNRATVLRWLKKAGVSIRNKSEAVHLAKSKAAVWNQHQISALEGELLGDGSVPKRDSSRPKRDNLFGFQSPKKTFALFVKKSFPIAVFNENAPYCGGNMVWGMHSRGDPVFTVARNKWYPNGKKGVPVDFRLNNVSALHWYLGDGCLERYKGKIRRILLFCYDFERVDVENLSNQLKSFGFGNYLYFRKNHGTGWIIFIQHKYVNSFLEWIGECPVSEYKYKWGS